VNFAIGDTDNLGTEAHHQAMHREMPMTGLDGRPYPYFPMHKGNPGADPAFPDNADHVATVTAHDADGKVTRQCTCGARWSWYPNEPGRMS
jgi:hypothetical protein